eukprot:g2704.t1
MRLVFLLPLILAVSLALISQYAPLNFPPPYENRSIELEPISATPTPLEGVFKPNEVLRNAPNLFKNTISEPETIIFDQDGGMFLFAVNGIYRSAPTANGGFSDPVRFIEIKNGRPLSGAFDSEWNIYFCDGFGKLNVTDRSYEFLIGSDELCFCDDVVIATNGDVFFTDATNFKPADLNSLRESFLATLANGGAYGRILKYTPVTGETQVLVPNVTFANGIELAHDESYLLYSDASICTIKRYWLKGPKRGRIETFLQQPLPGYSDGISKGTDSTYWLAILAPVNKNQLFLLSSRLTRWILYRIPPSITEELAPRHGAIAQVDENGKVLRSFHDTSGRFGRVTSVTERSGKLYIGSFNNFVKVLDLNYTTPKKTVYPTDFLVNVIHSYFLMITTVSRGVSYRPHTTFKWQTPGRCPCPGSFGARMTSNPRSVTITCNAAVEKVSSTPSWAELEELVHSKGTELGDLSLTQEDYLESGPTNPYSLKRTFGKKEPIRIKLYRDSAAWIQILLQIWLQLEEKRIPYTVEKIMLSSYGKKPESFLKIAPKGTVPVMELDGKVILESDNISEVIEAEFPETPLIPPKGTPSYARFEEITEKPLQFLAWITNPKDPEANETTMSRLDQLESYLAESKSGYFLNEGFSMADVRMITMLERIAASAMYYVGFNIRDKEKYPNLTKWFDLMESRPCYIATRTDYFTFARIVKVLNEKLEVQKEAEAAVEWIEGKTGLGLPLDPLSKTSIEPYAPGDNPVVDTYEASKRLIQNHEAVVKFALRGGQSSEEAEIDEESLQYADEAFRTVAQALLLGVDEVKKQDLKIPDKKLDAVVSALEHIRDRVGVPRDLKLPAARQLRAHMNWMLDGLKDYLESGPTNPYSLKRTFGKKEPIRIKLYRDSAAWCPYCQRIWLQLEEKRIPYTVEKIMLNNYGKKPESFLKISPKGTVPVVELDGKVILESDNISEVIEAEFPEIPLIPSKGTLSYARFKEITDISFPWLAWLTASDDDDANKRILEILDQLESYLADSNSGYFLNEGFSLADIRIITRMERLSASGLYFRGYKIRNDEKYPNFTRWFEFMESRPCYIATRTDYFTYVRILKTAIPQSKMRQIAPVIRDWIDGETGMSLPLDPLSKTSIEPYTPGDNPPVDTYEAGKKLIQNHEAVVKFALRRGQSSEEAEIDEESLQYADEAFRTVAQALLLGVDEVKKQDLKIPDKKLDAVVSALEHIRDRVGVPRDLKLPAARQLRAHMNWMLDGLVNN